MEHSSGHAGSDSKSQELNCSRALPGIRFPACSDRTAERHCSCKSLLHTDSCLSATDSNQDNASGKYCRKLVPTKDSQRDHPRTHSVGQQAITECSKSDSKLGS